MGYESLLPQYGSDQIISSYTLIEGEYQVNQYVGDDRIQSPTFPELNLTVQQIFEIGNIA